MKKKASLTTDVFTISKDSVYVNNTNADVEVLFNYELDRWLIYIIGEPTKVLGIFKTRLGAETEIAIGKWKLVEPRK